MIYIKWKKKKILNINIEYINIIKFIIKYYNKMYNKIL